MAKKGGVQQLQADLTTDEDFEKFIDRPGLLVLDVYSEWCGPCLGMVGSLKKIKLELGGDNLQLAICKSDTISYLKRFNRRSEPTWLFVTGGKATNLMYGTNVPKLIKLITQELNMLNNKTRPRYAIDELQPEEVVRKKIREDAINEANRKEFNEREKKRRSYLTYVTDTIMENLPDIGVTVFGPQVNRDMFKKIMEPADALKIQCKDRRVTQVLREHFETINFACRNPLPVEVIDQLHEKELLVCFWKMPEETRRTLEDLLTQYGHDVMKTSTETVDGVERVVPGIISPLDISFEVELGEDEIPEPEPEPEPPRKKSTDPHGTLLGDGIDGEDGLGDNGLDLTMPDFDLDLDLDLGFETDEEKEPPPVIILPPKKYYKTVTVTVPPIWVPNNHRTHAALIYVYFRQQTGPFLPPDPVPEPPHIIMAFEAYKRRDLLNLADRLREDIPAFGFFTSDEVNEAVFIASSSKKYSKQQHSTSDRIIFKVSKASSNTMLAMAKYNPTYCSPNTVVGKAEAQRLFPEDYEVAEHEPPEPLDETGTGKRRKRTKTKSAATTEDGESASMGSLLDDDDDDDDDGEGGSSDYALQTEEGEEGMLPPEGMDGVEDLEAAAAEADADADAAEEAAEQPPAEEETPAPIE